MHSTESKQKNVKKSLTSEQQKIIDQVVASMAISGMTLSQEAYENLKSIAVGEKTEEEVVAEIIKKYSNNK